MKYKFYIKCFLIFSFVLISLLPSYNFYQYAKNYDFKKSFNIDTVEKYLNYTVYKLFNISLKYEQVISGKDGFLFLGNKYDAVLHKTNGNYRPSTEEIKNWTKKLKDLQSWYENKGIKFIIVIAPNKHSIYKEKLPNWMNYDGKTITDDIIEAANKENINLLDLRSILISQKDNENLLYNKQGSHWNTKGSAIGFEATMNKLSSIYNINISRPLYEFTDYKTNNDSMWLFLKIKDLLKDVDYDNEYKLKIYDEIMCHGNINLDNNKMEKCINENNPIINIDGGPKYVLNPNPLNNYNILMLCDSFSTSNSQLFNASFKTVWKWHSGHINGLKLASFIEENKPNIVIYQIVERGLFSHDMVKKLKTNESKDLIPENIVDNNWQNGILRGLDNIFVVSADENYLVSQMKTGYNLQFNSGIRKIIDIKQNGFYVNITVDGDKLDPIKDGYPNKIKLIGTK